MWDRLSTTEKLIWLKRFAGKVVRAIVGIAKVGMAKI